MHYLSVGAILKNEGMVLGEWIEHYLFHGVDHFYLIDDNSTDNSIQVLEPYINKGLVTLFTNDLGKFRGRQGAAYNKFFKPILAETFWIAILDIDEYLYSPITIDLKRIFRNLEKYALVQVNWLWFGSNGLKEQPKSIVESFVQRAPMGFTKVGPTPTGYQECGTEGPKIILNTNFHIENMNVHFSDIQGPGVNVSWKNNPKTPILLINHYAVMSEEYWQKVKMERGDADCWHSDTARNMDYFKCWDINIETDMRLYDQNKPLFQK